MPINQNTRTGAGTVDNPLTDIQIRDLTAQGIREGDTMQGRGQLLPDGTFTGMRNPPQPGTAQTGTSVSDELNRIQGEAMNIQSLLDQRRAGEQTVGESLAGIGDGLNQFPSFNEIYGEPANEQDVMRNQMRLFQSEIDATNQIYDQMLNQARLEGTGRLGSQRAMSARGGLLGSDFAGAQKATVQDFNTGIERGIQAERAAAIGAIMGNVRSSVQQQLAEKRQARQQGAENYLNWLANSEQRRNQNASLIAQDLLLQGIDPTTLSEEELTSITGEAGVQSGEVQRMYRQMAAQQALEEAELAEEAAQADAGTVFSTSRGLVRVDGQGNASLIFDSGGGATQGQTASRSTGGTTQPRTTTSTLTASQRRPLLAAGLTDGDIDSITSDISQHGVPAVLEGITDPDQRRAVADVYGANVPVDTQTSGNEQRVNNLVSQLQNRVPDFTRTEMNLMLERQFRSQLGLGANDDIPSGFQQTIDETLNQLYGQSSRWSWLPWVD